MPKPSLRDWGRSAARRSRFIARADRCLAAGNTAAKHERNFGNRVVFIGAEPKHFLIGLPQICQRLHQSLLISVAHHNALRTGLGMVRLATDLLSQGAKPYAGNGSPSRSTQQGCDRTAPRSASLQSTLPSHRNLTTCLRPDRCDRLHPILPCHRSLVPDVEPMNPGSRTGTSRGERHESLSSTAPQPESGIQEPRRTRGTNTPSTEPPKRLTNTLPRLNLNRFRFAGDEPTRARQRQSGFTPPSSRWQPAGRQPD